MENLIILIIILQGVCLYFLITKLSQISQLEKNHHIQDQRLKDEMQRNREELSKAITLHNDSILSRMADIATLQKNQLDTFSKQLESLTGTVEKRLHILQEDNAKKLEQMRSTVDEKLHSTLEKRLGESFKVVGDRLEQVHKGLGEMQTLASGVGDLKKVLANVKTRGTWGEVQLGNLLEQILTPNQFEQNVATKKNSSAYVEYAIKLPGKDLNDDKPVWLPIDAKFPQDAYQQLLDAQEKADLDAIAELSKQLDTRIKLEAKNIQEKYIDPPNTTDFGILFLPTEGLYAEVLRRGMQEELQRKYRVMVAGPSTLAALLNSLQMGFRTVAIEKRSSEVWSILSTVKVEFSKFGDILDKTQKKLQEAGNTIETAARKSRTIERKLRNVQDLPESSADTLAFNIVEN